MQRSLPILLLAGAFVAVLAGTWWLIADGAPIPSAPEVFETDAETAGATGGRHADDEAVGPSHVGDRRERAPDRNPDRVAPGAEQADGGRANEKGMSGTGGTTLRLSGRVVGAAGAPVADASIHVVPAEDGRVDSTTKTRVSEVTSRSDGGFDVEFKTQPGVSRASFRLTAAKKLHRPGEMRVTWELGQRTPPVELRLVAYCEMAGRVEDETGKPVAGAAVAAVPKRSARTVKNVPVKTETDGAFVLAVEDAGPLELLVSARGFTTRSVDVPDSVPGTAVAVDAIVLEAGLSIRGIVANQRGEPLRDRIIEAHRTDAARRDATAKTVSRDGGTFVLSGLERATYRVICRGRDTQTFTMRKPQPVEVAAPSAGVVLRIEEHLLAVTVLDQATGAAIDNPEVRLLRRVGGNVESEGVGKKGNRFLIGLDAQVAYRLVARAEGYRASEELPVTLGRDETQRDVTIRLKHETSRSLVELHVRGEGGAPITQVRLEYFRVREQRGTFLAMKELADARGVYRTQAFPAGRYVIRVHSLKGRAERDTYFRAEVDVELGADGVHRRDVQMRKGGLFVLHVKDGRGRYVGNVRAQVGGPLRGATTRRLPMEFCVLTANTTSCDNDLIPKPGAAVPGNALAPGRYEVALACEGFLPRTVPFAVEYDRVTPVHVTLTPR